MIIPIVLIAMGIAGCVASGEDEDTKEEGDASEGTQTSQHINVPTTGGHPSTDQYVNTIIKSDATKCPPPQSYIGDGKYKVAVGDSIQASNGITIKITGPDPFVGTAYYFNADVYAGQEKLNLPPVRFTNNWCREVYGVYVSMGKYNEADECGRLPLKVTSFFNGPIAGRGDLYQSCLNSGYKHGVCADYIPWGAAPNEAVYEEAKFKVFTPQDTNPMIGQFFLKQLKQCYRPLLNHFGVPETAPAISLRWYLNDGGYTSPVAHISGHHINWPWVFGEQEAEQLLNDGAWDLNDTACSEYTVAHELSKLMWDGMTYHHYVEGGLAVYAERTATTKMFEDEPVLKAELSAGDSIKLPVSQYELAVKEIDEKNKEVAIVSGNSTNLHGVRTIAYYSEHDLLAVEDISNQTAKIRIYSVPSKTIPWTIAPVCGETGYTEHYGFFVGGDFYYSIQDNPYAEPYESLSYPKGVSNADVTAYCFWKQIADLYGEDVIRQFLGRGAEVREKNLGGIGAEFCWVKSLNEIVGADLGPHFAKFDLPYDENDCAIWTEDGSYIDHNKVCPSDAK